MSWFSDNCLKYKKKYSSAQYVGVWPERNPAMIFSASEEGRLEGALGLCRKKAFYYHFDAINRRKRLVQEWKTAHYENEIVFDRVYSAVFGSTAFEQVSGVLGDKGIVVIQNGVLVCTAGLEDAVLLPKMSSSMKEFSAEFIRYRSPIIIGIAGDGCAYQRSVLESALRLVEGASLVSLEALKQAYKTKIVAQYELRDSLSKSIVMVGSKRRASKFNRINR